MKNILNKKIGGIIGILAIAAITLGCIGGDGGAVKKNTYKVEAPDWEVGDYFLYVSDNWVDKQDIAGDNDDYNSGYAELWTVTDEKTVNDIKCWEVQVITSDGYNYTAYISKDKFSLVKLYKSHYNSSYVEMWDYYEEDGLLWIIEEEINLISNEVNLDYYWKMDQFGYNYTLNRILQYEDYYFEYNYLWIKSHFIIYLSIRTKYTFDWDEFDVLNVYTFGPTGSMVDMWYSSEFGLYEGTSPITEANDLLLVAKGNNEDILNDSNSDHIPDALAQADVDILQVYSGTKGGNIDRVDMNPSDADLPYMNMLNDSGVAKIVNTTIYAYRTIEQANYKVPNLNGNVSIYIYKHKNDIGYDTSYGDVPTWTLVAKAEDIEVTWFTRGTTDSSA